MKHYGMDTGKGRNVSNYDPTEERKQMKRGQLPKRKPRKAVCPKCGK